MKNLYKHLLGLMILFSFLGCNDYLDIVPDRTQEVSLMFERKDAAYTALATCYSYLPQNDDLYGTFALASDEITMPFAKEPNSIKLMKGEQVADNPFMSFWSGYGASGRGQGSLWDGIRACNTLIANIDLAVDMTQVEKNTWKAEAMVLKAYYHFLLLNYYGPIPIVENNISVGASAEETNVFRDSVDDVVNYLVQLLDEVIEGENLPGVINYIYTEQGRVTMPVAKALKAKITLDIV